MELKDIIKDYKYRHQLTNDEIAKKLGVTKSTVGRWISGDVKRIQDETLQRLNEILGYDVEPIIKGSSVHLKLSLIHIMDDFGTGYSSLSLLKNEPLDIIKIDQSFVRNITEDSFNYAFMNATIDLCHQIDLKVIVEGVETKDELDVIEKFNPDYIQGYYTGKPMDYKMCIRDSS